MAELPDVFKTGEHEGMSDNTVPSQYYLGEIVKSEIKKTKNGKGLRLNFQVKILEDEEMESGGKSKYEGRVIFIGLNIANPNSQCVQISKSELKSLCDSVGFEGELEDSDDLHGIPFGFKTKIEKSDGFDDKSVIAKYITEDEYTEILRNDEDSDSDD